MASAMSSSECFRFSPHFLFAALTMSGLPQLPFPVANFLISVALKEHMGIFARSHASSILVAMPMVILAAPGYLTIGISKAIIASCGFCVMKL